MGQPVTLQFPLQGGLDQKTADVYLDANAAQRAIVNGNFTKLGAIDKRFGIHADAQLATAVVLAPNDIAYAYASPSVFSTAVGGFGNVLLQGPWAWNVTNDPIEGQTSAFVGNLPNCDVTRRPLPSQTTGGVFVCDGIVSLQGRVRLAAWKSQVGSNTFVQTSFISRDTSEGLVTLPSLSFLNATDLQIVNVCFFEGTGLVVMFLAVTTAGGRQLLAYSLDPLSNSFTWTPQASVTLNLFNSAATSLDVQPFHGDPNNGFIVLYLPSGVSTQLTWKYFSGAFAAGSTGTLTAGTQPGLYPCFIQADWGVDVVFVWSDISGSQSLFFSWLSGDGFYTPITSLVRVPSTWSDMSGFPFSTFRVGGICRLYDKTNATLDSEIYVSLWAQDVTYVGQGGPRLPIAKGGLVARSGTTTKGMGFEYYPAGCFPIARPTQPTDGMQIVGSFAHVVHPCVQNFYYQDSYASSQAGQLVSLQVSEYLIDYRVRAQQGVPLDIFSSSVSVIASVAPRQLNPYTDRWTNVTHLPDPTSYDGASIFTPIAITTTGVSGISQAVGAQWLVNFTFTPSFTVTTINDTNQISGALPTRFYASGDSGASQVSEHGFIHYPEFVFAQTTGTGLTGTYSYAVVYLRQDANGNIERSAPVELATPIVLANQSAQVFFPYLSWWNTQNEDGSTYMVEIYRTLTLGSTYYCVTRLALADIAATSSILIGSYTDNLADSTLRFAEFLYTTGGILDNVNPPSANLACSHKGRYAIVDETLRNVWMTKAETSSEVLSFNEALITPFIEGGDITAIISTYDKFVAFKHDTIFVMYGDGPGDTGLNSDWTVPQEILTDVGCINAQSLAYIPMGILFQAETGFHLLGNDVQVQFIGKQVQDTVAAYPTCIAAVVVPEAKHVRFIMQASVGAQVCLVFDYLFNYWTTHSYAHLSAGVVDAFVSGDGFTLLCADGSRYVEGSNYLDVDNTGTSYFVPTSVTLPWVKISGPQGYQRSRFTMVLGTMNDPCGVQVQLAFNYDPTVKQSASWTYDKLKSGAQVRVHTAGPYNKCEAIQVALTDVDSTSKTTGQGMAFAAVSFDLDKIGDQYRKIPRTRKG